MLVVALVALRKESVDRNETLVILPKQLDRSLSARRAWIEIIDDFEPSSTRKSLSARRAWIEMHPLALILPKTGLSLSARRAWIEIQNF